MTFADWVVVTESAVTFGGLLYFVSRYAASTDGDWRKSAAGRHMMFFRGSLAAAMAMVAVHNIFTDYPGRDVVRILVFGSLMLATIQGDRLLEVAQKRRREELARRKASGPNLGQ